MDNTQDIPIQTDESCQQNAPLQQDSEKSSVEQNVLQQPSTEQVDEPPLQHPRRKDKKSSAWLNIFCIVSLVASLYFMYLLSKDASGGDQKSLSEIFANANHLYLILALGSILLMMFLDTLKYYVIMRATVGKRARYYVAAKTSLLGKYYDNITPFATGGQPMQIYYLHRKKYSGGESSAVVFIKFAFHTAIWLIICACLMIFNSEALSTYVTDETQRNLYTVAGWTGFGVNCLIPLTILTFVLFPKIAEVIAKGILWLGVKLKIVKDREKQLKRVKKSIKDFVNAFVSMIKRPWHTILLFIICVVELLLGMMLPYFVIVGVAGSSVTPDTQLMLAIMTLYVYVIMSVTVVPTPGNSGVLENAFMLTLTAIAQEVLFWSVFGWRFLSYYSYIIIGLFMTIGDMIRRNRKAKLAKLQEN